MQGELQPQTGVGTTTDTVTTTVTTTKTEISTEQRMAIETAIFCTAAADLERVLRLRLATFEPMEEDHAEATDEVAEEGEEFDSMDIDDFDADEEGDFTEEDESPLPLDGIGLFAPEEPHPRADVVIERVETDGEKRLVPRSGISDLLLCLRGSDTLTSVYRSALSKRIYYMQLIVKKHILDKNHNYFLQETRQINRLRRDELRKDLKKERLSRLLSASALLTPWGDRRELQDFFIARSAPSVTDEAVLQLFAEHFDDEQKNPLTDGKLTTYVNVLLQNEYRLGRTAITGARKRLGIPNIDERGKCYQQGMDFIAMIAKASACAERLRNMERLLERLLPKLKNEQARSWVSAWLQELKKHLQGE